MQILAIIQARVGSSRLPGKVLFKLGNKTILEHVIDRVRMAKKIDMKIVAYPLKFESSPIIRLCLDNEILGFAGLEYDVLDRYYQCANMFLSKHIVRITSDCPLINPELIDEVIQYHLDTKADYTSNRLSPPAYPDSEDVEIFTMQALTRAWHCATTYYEREHVSPYMKTDPMNICIAYHAPEDMSHIKYSLDTMEDFKEIKRRYYGSNNI